MGHTSVNSSSESAPGTEIRILHVDDDEMFTDLLQAYLERHGDGHVEVRSAHSAADGLDLIETEQFDCVVSDFSMPETNGLQFLQHVRNERPTLPFILFTGQGSEAVAGEAINAEVTDYLQKGGPEQFELLANRLTNAIEQYAATRQLDREQTIRNRILEATPVGVVVHDVDGDVIYRNDRAEAILDAPQAELDGRAYEDASWSLTTLDGDPIESADLPYRRVIDSDARLADEPYRLVTRDGSVTRIAVYGVPLREDGTVTGAVIAFHVDEA